MLTMDGVEVNLPATYIPIYAHKMDYPYSNQAMIGVASSFAK